jgi:hypothetical protein
MKSADHLQWRGTNNDRRLAELAIGGTQIRVANGALLSVRGCAGGTLDLVADRRADAFLDRLAHEAYRIAVTGKSMRDNERLTHTNPAK